MRRLLLLLILITPLTSRAQDQRMISMAAGATLIPQIGLLAQSQIEWHRTPLLGVTTGLGFAQRTIGLGSVTEGVGTVYTRLTTLNVRAGLAVHTTEATSIYPSFETGFLFAIKLAETPYKTASPPDIDRVFPMYYFTVGLRLPVKSSNSLGIGLTLEASPTRQNTDAMMIAGSMTFASQF